MRQIPLVDAKPDMVLAADVVNGQQMLLLKKGASLTAKNIKILKSWGISTIDIHAASGSQADDTPSDRTIMFEAIEAQLLKKFSQTAPNDVMQEIHRVASAMIMERLMQQDTGDVG